MPRQSSGAAAPPAPTPSPPPARPSRRLAFALLAAGLAVVLVSGVGLAVWGQIGTAPPAPSVAVLPFLDLTSQAMDEEYFADGMTEEVIDRLSLTYRLRVPAATNTFFYRGRKATIATIGKALKVDYVLDGSLRKSQGALRVAARLVRTDDGFIVWSQTYDRAAGDGLKVQDEVGRRIAAAISTVVGAPVRQGSRPG